MTRTKTDCNTEEGAAVGLIDAIISICKALAPLMYKHTPAIKEAVKDLHHTIAENELDVLFRPKTKEEIENRKIISDLANKIKRGSIKIRV